MPYAILYAANGTDDFQPLDGETHEQGGDAAARMKELQAQDGQGGRFKVRAVADPGIDPNAWRYRERAHFDYDRYIPCPWHREYWNDGFRWEHYAHLSLTEPGKIAYTASPEHGRSDRQTIIAPGRYLKRYFSERLNAQEIELYAAQVSVCAGDCALTFTSDPDEIEDVYVNGPNSCMSHREGDYRGHCHPVRAYGNSPDLQLAYIGTKDEPSGRTIVWPERKVYTSTYGDCSRIRLLLDVAGYTQGSLTGARLKPLTDENGNGYIMPYIDGIGYCAEQDGYLVLGRGHIHCQSTEGSTEEDCRSSCQNCDERVDDGDLNYIADVESYWCDECTSEGATRCEQSGNTYSDRRTTFHQVHLIDGWSSSATLTSQTVADCNLEDADAIYHEASGEYLQSDLYALVTALEEMAVSMTTLPDANQLSLALETIALEALAIAA